MRGTALEGLGADDDATGPLKTMLRVSSMPLADDLEIEMKSASYFSFGSGV